MTNSIVGLTGADPNGPCARASEHLYREDRRYEYEWPNSNSVPQFYVGHPNHKPAVD